MITLTREEAQQVLDALEECLGWTHSDLTEAAHETLRAKVRRDEIWASRDLSKCECDHNEYCQHCWPVELRENKT